MIDKTAYAILEVIVAAAGEEDSIVLEKEEIIAATDNTVAPDELDSYVDDLCVNEMLMKRYGNAKLYAFTLLPKGRLACEKRSRYVEEKIVEAEKEERERTGEFERIPYNGAELPLTAKKTAAIAFLGALLGGLVAAVAAIILISL